MKNKLHSIKSLILLAIIVMMLITPSSQVFATGDTNTKGIPSVLLNDDGSITIDGGQFNQEEGPWETLFSQYRTVIAGISGIGALTMIVLFIVQFMKLASSAGNPQARSQALSGVLWTGLAATGLGAVSLVTGFFYNIL